MYADWKRDSFHDNAVRFFRLDAPAPDDEAR
jgi:hypothetical protein